ncbi:Nuclear pore complex protein [Balamuthia mandrillaris]
MEGDGFAAAFRSSPLGFGSTGSIRTGVSSPPSFSPATTTGGSDRFASFSRQWAPPSPVAPRSVRPVLARGVATARRRGPSKLTPRRPGLVLPSSSPSASSFSLTAASASSYHGGEEDGDAEDSYGDYSSAGEKRRRRGASPPTTTTTTTTPSFSSILGLQRPLYPEGGAAEEETGREKEKETENSFNTGFGEERSVTRLYPSLATNEEHSPQHTSNVYSPSFASSSFFRPPTTLSYQPEEEDEGAENETVSEGEDFNPIIGNKSFHSPTPSLSSPLWKNTVGAPRLSTFVPPVTPMKERLQQPLPSFHRSSFTTANESNSFAVATTTTATLQDFVAKENNDFANALDSTLQRWPIRRLAQEAAEEGQDYVTAHGSMRELFSLLDKFHQLCQRQMQKVEEQLEREYTFPTSSLQKVRYQQMLSLLQGERSTWKLFSILYEDRVLGKHRRARRPSISEEEQDSYFEGSKDEGNDEQEELLFDKPSEEPGALSSEKQIAGKLLNERHSLRETRLVVSWLEAMADMASTSSRSLFRIDASWKNTQRTLPSSSNGENTDDTAYLSLFGGNSRLPSTKRNRDKDNRLVSNLDPDAPTREHKTIHEDDKDAEERMFIALWQLIRAGRMEEAQQLCRDCGQPWRAASIGGGQLCHDAALVAGDESEDERGNVLLEGNPFRALWKLACYQLSNQEELNSYEKAIYAILCGNIPQVLPVCASWEDHLWVYSKAKLDASIDLELKQNDMLKRTTIHSEAKPPVAAYAKSLLMSNVQIFEKLLKSDNPEVRRQVNDPHHITQTLVILDKPEELLEKLAEWVQWTEEGRPCPPQLLRFAAHVAIFFHFLHGFSDLLLPKLSWKEQAEQDEREEERMLLTDATPATPTSKALRIEEGSHAEAILQTYIKHLVSTDQFAHIALYTSLLPSVDQQVETYAHFLAGLSSAPENRAQRERYLALAESAGLNTNQITKRVVHIIQTSSLEEEEKEEISSASAANQITAEDENKIRAIEWLTFDPQQRAEALIQSNSLARKFLLQGKHTSARRLLDFVPRDSVAVIQQWTEGERPAEELNAVKEHMALNDYLSSQQAYQDWASVFRKQPQAPAPPLSDDASQQILFSRRMKDYKEALAKWEESVWKLTNQVVKALSKVLFFPNGWLLDEVVEVTEGELQHEERRERQLEELRRRCIPDLFILYHNVLYETKQYQDSARLADIVADESTKFYSLFSKQELRAFLALINKSVMALVDTSPDPLHYD